MLEVEFDGDTEIIVNANVEVTASNTNVAIVEDTNDIEVTVNRQEYVITGDEIYIPKRFEDAPTWMQNLITQVVDTSISAQIQDLNGISQSLESMIDAMEVAKNTYEMSIISSNDIDQRINTAVTTLNSNMQDADSTILEVAQTRTTPEEAATIAIDVISAQLGSTTAGTIGATVSELQTAIANEEEARSTSIEVLTSSIEGAFDVNATAMNYLNTYVGLDEAGASTGTGLSGYLEGTDGQIGSAGSQLINDIELKTGEVESKFAYNSTVTLNGVTHTSGFGIATTIDSENIPEGESQFWISADEFKIVGANQTAEAQGPFTVNTTTGDITFNGEVTFNAVDAVYADTIVDNTTTNNDLLAQRLGYLSYADMVAAATNGQTIINGGYLRTSLIEANSIVANQIDTVGLVAENISSNTIEGKTITGSVINGGTINGTNIIGVTIRASYLDLDGDLEILTDFYLCVGGNTTGVPALAISEGRYRTYNITDIDAILSTEYSNLYRIPSISTLTYNNTLGKSYSNLYTNIWSYSTADAGNNNKARKRVPVMTVSGGVFSIGNETNVATSKSCSAYIYIGNVLLIGIVIYTGGNPDGNCDIYNHTGLIGHFNTQSVEAISVVSHGITFSGTLTNTGIVNLDGNVGALALASNWTSGRIHGVVGGNDGTPYFNIPTITINNML